MIPKQAIEKAISGGWTNWEEMARRGDDTKESWLRYMAEMEWQEIALDPTFWVALCKSIGATEGEINMCVGCGRAARHSENISFGKCPKCGDSLYRYDGQWLIEMHRFVDAIAENKVEQFWAGWQELIDTPKTV